MNSTEVFKELKTYENLYSYLATHTGMTVRDPDDVQSIYSTLKAEVIRILSNLFVLQCRMNQFKMNQKVLPPYMTNHYGYVSLLL